MNVVVTGAGGFLGKNLCVALEACEGLRVYPLLRESKAEEWCEALANADLVYHLAGVNRPQHEEQFDEGNAALTRLLCEQLLTMRRSPTIVFSSSTQAALENPYGASKRAAEEALREYALRSGARVVVHRLGNLFGKWCRPHYNSVVATFCHAIARGEPIAVSDPERVLNLTYVDEVIAAFIQELKAGDGGQVTAPCASYSEAASLPKVAITLGELAALIRSFKEQRESLLLPDFSRPLVRQLYATYLSHLPQGAFAYALTQRQDARGVLAEFVKSPAIGQIFVSRTEPGVTRGNHFHNTKVEKFCVVEGQGVVRFRSLEPGAGECVLEYPVCGDALQVVDIPPGYTHSIENTGRGVLITLFWASEVFDSAEPDTRFSLIEVQKS